MNVQQKKTILCEYHSNQIVRYFCIDQTCNFKRLLCSECFRQCQSHGQKNTLPIENLLNWIENKNRDSYTLITNYAKSFKEIENLYCEIQQRMQQLYIFDLQKLTNLTYHQINNLISQFLAPLQNCENTIKQNIGFQSFYQDLQDFKQLLFNQECSYQDLQTFKYQNSELNNGIILNENQSQRRDNKFNIQCLQHTQESETDQFKTRFLNNQSQELTIRNNKNTRSFGNSVAASPVQNRRLTNKKYSNEKMKQFINQIPITPKSQLKSSYDILTRGNNSSKRYLKLEQQTESFPNHTNIFNIQPNQVNQQKATCQVCLSMNKPPLNPKQSILNTPKNNEQYYFGQQQQYMK